MSRVFFRLSVAFVVVSLAIATFQPAADARARVIAVIVFRSTPGAKAAALSASKALASRLSQEPGWEAITVDAHGKAPADAAAAVGAELYVVGQYFAGTPARIAGATYRVATDERLGDFSASLEGSKMPATVSFAALTAAAATTNSALTAQVRAPAPSASVTIPSGNLISVAILSDIGSRISQEGDTFAVQTVEDYYYKGQLILPKGSPGYGVITHLKRAGSFHAGGELNFTVKRLVTPSKTDLLVETNGATADADKETEHNGNAFGQYLLWGVGMFAKRGNDILIKKGTTFHVSTLQNSGVPIANDNAQPAALDPAFTIGTGSAYVPPAQTDAPAPSADVIAPPQNWSKKPWTSTSSDFTTIGYWTSPNQDQTLGVIAQQIPSGMTPSEFVQLTVQSLQNSIGRNNVRTFQGDRICNGTASGWYIESNVTAGASPAIAEQSIGVADSLAYIATYRRPATESEDSGARAALRSLCPAAA